MTTALDQPSSSVETDEIASSDSKSSAPAAKPKARHSKYRHVAAYHSQARHSSLSREANVTTSFLGFRNLMVLVLGRH